MKTLGFFLLFLLNGAHADDTSAVLFNLCERAFTKESEMSRSEVRLFCTCVRDDVSGRLSPMQLRVLSDTKAALEAGRSFSPDRFASSGIRDLVVAGQARCEAAFYPPSGPISIRSSNLTLVLGCEIDSMAPELFVHFSNVALVTDAQIRSMEESLFKENYQPEYVKVAFGIDGGSYEIEDWEVSLTGDSLSPRNSANLITRLRTASALKLEVRSEKQIIAGTFKLSGRIHPRWMPCGGVLQR